MTDVRLAYSYPRFDIRLLGSDLETDEGLETAVSLSLWTDRRVSEEELPPGEEERRGWFGDEISDFAGDLIGSKLWLLERQPVSQITRGKAADYAREALQWLVDDGVAREVSVTATLINREAIEIQVDITRPNVKNRFYHRYQLLWEGQLMQVRKVG